MSAAIIINPKQNLNSLKLADFFSIIDRYINAHGFIIINGPSRIYLSHDKVSPSQVKDLIKVIKATKDYNNIIHSVYYSNNLTKG